MEIQNIKLTDIKPYSKNAKKHTQEQINKVAKSIEEFGFIQPMVLDKNNEIVIGHCRFDALKKINRKEAPCYYVDDLSDEKVRALRLADNKLNESDYDMGLVLEELDTLDIELQELTGFDLEELEEPTGDDLIGEYKNKPFAIKCTFKNQEDMENAKVEIEEILNRYEKSFLSVSGGEL